MSDERVIDVSDLEPCEPLERTLDALETLAPGERLCVLHRREPHMLYPILAERGYKWETTTGARTAFEIRIWRNDKATA